MEEIGVQLIVMGLDSFIGNMHDASKSILDMVGAPSLLQDAFGSLGSALGDFSSWVGDVLTFTLGGLLKDAIEGVVSVLGEMVDSTIEAGNQFQTLKLRLDGLNLQALIESGLNYNDAMEQSTKVTSEQLSWLQKLAAATPFDNTDVSNVYTLARSYGFADDEAKKLTESVSDFTSGMGLSGDTLERVITNLGQMRARGKITSTEMRDLARGAFLPLDDILKRIVDDMNASGKSFIDNSEAIGKNDEKLKNLQESLRVALQRQSEFTDKTKESTRMANQLTIDKLRSQIDGTTSAITNLSEESKKLLTVPDLIKAISKPGEGIPADFFIKAFEEMVQEEPRFVGASERMARTFGAATDNLKDMVTSFGGLNIVTPILDLLGGKIASFMDQFIRSDDAGQSYTELGQKLLDASISIGESLTKIIESVLGLLPSSNGLATILVSGVESFANWLSENKEGIIDGIISIFNWIVSLGSIDFLSLGGGLIGGLMSLWSQLFDINKETKNNGFGELVGAIGAVGTAIAGVLEPFLKPLGITLEGSRPSIQGFVDGLNGIADWISKNRALLQLLLGAFIAFEVIQTITNLVFGLAAGLFGLVSAILAVAIGGGILLLSFLAIIGVLPMFAVGLFTLQVFIAGWANSANFWIDLVIGFFQNLVRNVQTSVAQIVTSFQQGDFGGMIQGTINLMLSVWNAGIGSFTTAAMNFGTSVVDGFRIGFFAQWVFLLTDIGNAFSGMVTFIKGLLGIASPSKIFAGIGTNMIAGMAQGITDATGLAVGAMEGMVAAVTMPAIAAPAVVQQYSQMAPSSISSTYQSSQTNNLNIHTSAAVEPIIADFRMMQSLTGV